MERCLGCMNEYDETFDVCPYCGYVKGTAEKSKNHLSPGTVLTERYLIGRCLGQGGFGITYIAWDQRLYKKVAIKEFMPTSLASRITGQMDITCYNDEAQARFQNGIRRMLDESRRLARFNDLESVVKVYDCFEANQTAYIIMELLEGENIKNILAEQGALDYAETVRIMLPVLQAMREIHAAGLIHRDISPDNIFVCKNGKVKILDFGSARVASGSDDKSLSVILKPGYAPKEQYSSSAAQGPYTDVYAVCATIYKMLTGVTPIDSLERRVQEDLLEPIDHLAAVPEEIAQVIMQGLAVEAKDRLQTVDALIEAFSQADTGTPDPAVKVKKTQPKAKKRKPKKTKKALLWICLAVLLVGAAGTGVWALSRHNGPQESTILSSETSTDPSEAEYTSYQQGILQAACAERVSLEMLPQPEQWEKIRKTYASSLTYTPDMGKLYAVYSDADGNPVLREQISLPENEALSYTLYTYTKNNAVQAIADYSADCTLQSAERYFYNKDGTLFAHSVYSGDVLKTEQDYPEYTSDGKPAASVLRYGNGSVEHEKYRYDDETVEYSCRKNDADETVYECVRSLVDGQVNEAWYSDNTKTTEITRTVDKSGRPTGYIVEKYGLPFESYTWEYNPDSGRLSRHAVFGKDSSRQQSAIVFKYEKGKLRWIEAETERDIKECQVDLTGGYVLYTYDDRRDMVVRESFSADGEPVGRIIAEYDDAHRKTRLEYRDENDDLLGYRDEYVYFTEGSAYGEAEGYSSYDKDGNKQFQIIEGKTEPTVWKTEFDDKEREVSYSVTEDGVLRTKRTTVYLSGGDREITDVTYDEGGSQIKKTVNTYTSGNVIKSGEAYDKNDSLRVRQVYDASGRPTELMLFDANESLQDRYEAVTILGVQVVRHYNEKGRLVDQMKENEMRWRTDLETEAE